MPAFDEAFDALVERKLKEYHVPGISCAVVKGEEVFYKGYGHAHLPSTPATPSTQYYIGSITKGILALTWLQYLRSDPTPSIPLQDGKPLTLQTPLAQIIRDDFVLPCTWSTTHITLEDALCHRTGMPRHDNSYGGATSNTRAVTRSLRHLPLAHPPRTKYQYCNLMYSAAGHALETQTGEPVAETVKKFVFEPLGMQDSLSGREEALRKAHGDVRLYDGYAWIGEPGPGGEGRFEVQEHIEFGPVDAAGFVVSNVLDMAKYLKALLGRERGVLSEEVREELTVPRVPMVKEDYADGWTHYGLGYWRYFFQGVEIFSHTGGLTGYTSLMAWIPSKNWAFVSLGNAGNAVYVHRLLLYHLIYEMQSVAPDARFDFDKKFQPEVKKSVTRDPSAAQTLYPSAPSPGLPAALPLQKYTGTYHNAGYRSVTFKLIKEAKTGTPYLFAELFDRVWLHVRQLFHVSGEYWAGYKVGGRISAEQAEEGGRPVDIFHVQFRVGVSGEVEALGLEMETDMGKERWEERLIWFERVEREE